MQPQIGLCAHAQYSLVRQCVPTQVGTLTRFVTRLVSVCLESGSVALPTAPWPLLSSMSTGFASQVLWALEHVA